MKLRSKDFTEEETAKLLPIARGILEHANRVNDSFSQLNRAAQQAVAAAAGAQTKAPEVPEEPPTHSM